MRRGIRGTTVTLTNLMPVRRGNRTDWYFRKKGQKLVRLPDLPHDHPDFLAAYAAARKAAEAAARPLRLPPGTLGALIEATVHSDRFLSRSAVYRATLRRHFEAIRRDGGEAPAKGLRDRHIRANVATAESPVDRRKAWRFLCAFGVDAGLLEIDPSLTVTLPRAPKTIGHPAWTAADIDAFRTRWPIGTSKRAAFELLHWTGFRIGDAVMIGPGHVDRAGVLIYTQSKVKQPAFVPWTARLPAYAECHAGDRDAMHDALAALGSRHMTFLATAAGAPRSEKGLGNMIRAAAAEADIEKSAHGLRKTRGVALAEAGASAHQIMSWLGHQTLKEAEYYTRQASRRRAVMGEEQEQNVATHAAQVATFPKKS